MTDVVDRETRSWMMAGIRGRDTRPEMALRRALHARGFRYRLHGADLPGRPDLVFPRHRAVVFVHGCFWNRHPGCRYATTPATREAFWSAKFDANVARDRRVQSALSAMGWRVASYGSASFEGASTPSAPRRSLKPGSLTGSRSSVTALARRIPPCCLDPTGRRLPRGV